MGAILIYYNTFHWKHKMPFSVHIPVIQGDGIKCEDGVTVNISDAFIALINGSQQESGKNIDYLGIDEAGIAGPVNLIIRTGMASAINLLTLRKGELAVTDDTHELKVGDGVTAGGLSVLQQASSGTTIYIEASGTSTQNGAALEAAYAAAKLMTPQGSALGSRNRATIKLGPGVYEHSGITCDSNFVDIIGSGSAVTSIINTGAFTVSNTGMALKGIRFAKNNNGTQEDVSFVFATLNSPTNDWEDLFFDTYGSTTNNAMTTQTGGTIGGTYRKLRTTGQRLIGNVNGLTCTSTTLFEDCEAGNLSLLGASSALGSSPGNMAGTMRRCIINGTAWNVKPAATAKILGCEFYCPIPRLIADATIDGCLIAPQSSAKCLGNNTDTVAVKVSRTRLKTFVGATPYATGITNALGDSQTVAMNVHSDSI